MTVLSCVMTPCGNTFAAVATLRNHLNREDTRHMVRHLVLGLSLVTVLTVFHSAKADFIPGFTGNSQTVYTASSPTTPEPGADGLINFAVYDNTVPGGPNGNWFTALQA